MQGEGISHTLTDNLQTPINLQHVFFGLWEKTRVPGGDPRMYGENMQILDRKAPAGNQTWNLLIMRQQC